MILCHDDLENYYATNFQLMYHHKYSLTELENMFPFERDIYMGMILKHLDELKKQQERGF